MFGFWLEGEGDMDEDFFELVKDYVDIYVVIGYLNWFVIDGGFGVGVYVL